MLSALFGVLANRSLTFSTAVPSADCSSLRGPHTYAIIRCLWRRLFSEAMRLDYSGDGQEGSAIAFQFHNGFSRAARASASHLFSKRESVYYFLDITVSLFILYNFITIHIGTGITGFSSPPSLRLPLSHRRALAECIAFHSSMISLRR